MREGADIVIVVPPFANIDYPSIGAGLLAAKCKSMDLSCQVHYANLDYAARVGYDPYMKMAFYNTLEMVGERLFKAPAFDPPGSAVSAETFHMGLQPYFQTAQPYGGDESGLTLAEVNHYLSQVDVFIEDTVAEIAARRPKIVGFSCIFLQILPCIAIARRLKREYPHMITAVGGANIGHPMGEALSSVTGAFDFYFSGEADFEFPAFCRAYLENGLLPEKPLIDCDSVFDMDTTAAPDYDDYFHRLNQHKEAGHLPQFLPRQLLFESSRGCWWGVKVHCTFCGLNAMEMRYRRKSTDRILEDVFTLRERYDHRHFFAADNIMPYEFTKDVLPQLAEKNTDLTFFYEVKANLKESDLDLFVKAGITKIQPGIESLSTNVLTHIGKGVTGIQNLKLLRDCVSRQILIGWNMLAGVPGETVEDYEAMLTILPALEHLIPPTGWFYIVFDRYSPYQKHPERYQIQNLRPLPVYREFYPEGAPLADLAYHFVGDYSTPFMDDEDLQRRFSKALGSWTTNWNVPTKPVLALRRTAEGSTLVEDTRRIAQDRYFFMHSHLFDTLCSFETPVHHRKIGGFNQENLNELLTRGFVIRHEGYFLSLVTKPSIGARLRQRTVMNEGILTS